MHTMTFPHSYRVCMRTDGITSQLLKLADVLGVHRHPLSKQEKREHKFSFLHIPVNQTFNVNAGILFSSYRNQKNSFIPTNTLTSSSGRHKQKHSINIKWRFFPLLLECSRNNLMDNRIMCCSCVSVGLKHYRSVSYNSFISDFPFISSYCLRSGRLEGIPNRG